MMGSGITWCLCRKEASAGCMWTGNWMTWRLRPSRMETFNVNDTTIGGILRSIGVALGDGFD